MSNKLLKALGRIAPLVTGGMTAAALHSMHGSGIPSAGDVQDYASDTVDSVSEDPSMSLPVALAGGVAAGGATGGIAGLHRRYATHKARKNIEKTLKLVHGLLSPHMGMGKAASFSAAALAGLGNMALHNTVRNSLTPADYHMTTGMSNIIKAMKKNPAVQAAVMHAMMAKKSRPPEGP